MNQQEELDKLYFKALGLERKGDFVGAFDLFMQGNFLGDAASQHSIGAAYDSGSGVEKDKKKAILWFKKAWRTGKQSVYCQAVALTYAELGQRRRAIYWWQKAILLSDGGAALSLAKFLMKTDQLRLSSRVIDLLKRAAQSQEPWQISPDEKEEAQELLNKLTIKSN